MRYYHKQDSSATLDAGLQCRRQNIQWVCYGTSSRHGGLQIASSSLDIWRCDRAIARSEDLVTYEEASQVVILLELIHDGGKGIALRFVPSRRNLFDLRVEGVQIQPNIYTGIGKRTHTLRVILRRVNVVNAN